MEPSNTAAPGLQFDRAEFTAAAPQTCAGCKQSIGDVYFSINDKVVCPRCRQAFAAFSRVTPLRIAKALGLGLGAAVVSAAVWGGIRESTGSDFGLVAIGVGILIGFAVRLGSDKTGGWPYQVIALALTYLCIGLSFLPSVYSHGAGRDPLAMALTALFMVVAAPAIGMFTSIMGAIIFGIAYYNAFRITRRPPNRIAGPLRAAPLSRVAATAPAPLPPVIPGA